MYIIALDVHHSTGCITLTVLNAQSLNNKAVIFNDFIYEHQPDLLAATETWFSDRESASKTQCTPGGYKFFDNPRSGRQGGGTGLLFKNNLQAAKVDGGERQSFEYSEWKVTSGSQRINLIIVYRPPYSVAHSVTSAVFFVEFAEYLESIVLSADPLLIVEDFNIHIDSNENYDAIKFLELLQSFSLTQHVEVPTHSSGHTLDLIITRKTDNLVSSVPRAVCLFSDHMPVFCELDMGKVRFTKSKVSYRNLSAMNLDALRADLSNSDLCKNTDMFDVNELAMCYNETLKSAINRHAPLRTKTIVTRPYLPWFNTEVKSAKREQRRAERKWRRTKQPHDFQIYKSKKNYMIFVMNRSRKKFYTDFVLEHSSDQRKLFNAAKSLFHQRNDLNFPAYEDQIMLANDIGEFFVQKIENIRSELDLSASDLHNRVFDESITLNACFDSFEQLSEEDVKNLITKSNGKTSSLDPMATSIVIQCQDILLPVLTRMINMSLDSGVFPPEWKVADVCPLLKKSNLDTCAAFENLRPVSNLSYVSKLTERTVFNQTNDFLNTQRLYPKGQSAYRKCHSTETALLRVTNDIMMNMNRQHVTLLHCGKTPTSDAHAFADDSQLYVSFKPDSTCDQLAAVAALEHCIDVIKDWMLSDKLKVNDGKTEFLIIGTRQQLAKVNFNSLRIGDNSINSIDKAKNLGFCDIFVLIRFSTFCFSNVCSSCFRWKISIDRYTYFHVPKPRKIFKMNNYFSVGCDATVVLKFHKHREQQPSLFSSRLFNKAIYFGYGVNEVLEANCKNLQEKIQLEMDGRIIDLPELEGIVVLNINSWCAGVKMISGNDEDLPPVSFSDGKLEVCGLYSSFHIARMQVNLADPLLLGQAHEVKIRVKEKRQLPMQIDGEPWEQGPGVVTLSHLNQTMMLTSDIPM
ncbi:RNA-directed DNA polymerase from transposon X-element [Paramuricea clavata]|uniref:RNA-directed DNA polymerase from transposon X-element n=1 Tax=Paramuricea clavata TaxID=317549 RepID=A0A6S7GXA7_PARCT|nr:RNA-directed DNA polymerase from transposon X-element [Paramuricea clavata]